MTVSAIFTSSGLKSHTRKDTEHTRYSDLAQNRYHHSHSRTDTLIKCKFAARIPAQSIKDVS